MPGSLGDAYVNIIPKAPGISGKMEELLGDGAESGGKKAGSRVGSSMLSSLGKVVSVAAVGKVVKDAFSAGAKLEQSFGGLDTIYGDAAIKAKEFAAQAASAGISANSYAEQAVSFGASLKMAFGGDTEAAMQAANTAIMDMADNSAKMGTDINSVQAAYQGFAKQNYTMLDNLKLGYGGTKTEMERLLKTANEINKQNGKNTNYSIDNLGDVYEAIHVVQGELGLTGVAAAKAQTTLSGSFGAMKASWENLMAALTTGEGLTEAMSNLGKNAGNFITNVVRMFGNLTSQIPALLSGLFNTIGPEIIPAATGIVQGLITGIGQNLPQLLTSGTEMLMMVVRGLVNALPNLANTAITMIPTVINGIVSALPQILSTGTEILSTLVSGIVAALPQLLMSATEAVIQFATGIIDNLPQILAAGIKLLGELASGAVQGISALVGIVPQIFSQFAAAIRNTDWASIGRSIIDGIKNGISNAAGSLFNSLRDLARNALASAKEVLQIGSPSKLFADEVGRWIPAGISVGIEDNIPKLNRQIQSMIDTASLNLNRLQVTPISRAATSEDRQIVINQRIESVPQTPVQLAAATASYFEQARWTI